MNSVKGEFVNLSEELTDDAVSIEDIDEVLQTLERATSSETEIEEPLIEESSSAVESDEAMSEEVELDLSAGEMDKTSDPIRVYMREMGVVPLLTREQEVSIAKRIERGQKRAEKAIARSPIAVVELFRIGDELAAGTLNIRDVVAFSDAVRQINPISWGISNARITFFSLSRIRLSSIFRETPLCGEFGSKTRYLPAMDKFEVRRAPLVPIGSFTTWTRTG